MSKYLKYAITVVLTALAVTGFILFEIVHLRVFEDDVTNQMFGRACYYLAIAALFLWLPYILGGSLYLSFKALRWKNVVWCAPCLLVALANFPYSALISGQLVIIKKELIGLYILYVIGIALVEEMVFRGVLLFLLLDVFRNKKLPFFFPVLISSIIFALFHIANLFTGASIGDVLLQVSYTFLIGGMFAVMAIKTKSIWMGVIIHAIFDFGGLLNTTIAEGSSWDVVFWILTITCGILCAGHIVMSLINLERKHVS